MLLKMGWSAGKGAGKDESGISTHIKVEKREELLGIGSVQDCAGNIAFSKQITGFTDVLAALHQDHGEKKKTKKRKRSSKKQEGSDTDSVQSGSKKKSSKKDKKKKKESKRQKTIERKAHARLVRAKDVSKYSQNDLNAILGKK